MPNGTDSGVMAVEWSGDAGYARFRDHYGFASPDPSRYRATLRAAAIDGIRIGEWCTSPIAGVGRLPNPTGTALMLTVASGGLRYATKRGTVDGAPGSVHLLAASDGTRFSVPEHSRFILVMVPAVLLQQPLRAATATTIGPIVGSALTGGLTSLAQAVLDPAGGGTSSPAARAVRSLAIAALEESVPEPVERDLRERIIDHIDRNLGDPDLTPQSIADTFGISLRWVHQVFNVDEVSIARYIRERRLDVVASQLRSDHRFPRIGSLAERSGFGSRDQLTRTFKARFGMTIGEYAVLASEGRVPATA